MTIILVIYFLYILGFIIFSFLGLYHLWKYGFRGDMTKIAMISYIIISAIIIIFSLMIIISLQWGSFNFPKLEDLVPSFLR